MKISYKGYMETEPEIISLKKFVRQKLASFVYDSGSLETLENDVNNLQAAVAGLISFCAQGLDSEKLKHLLISMGIYIDDNDEFKIVNEEKKKGRNNA